MDFINITVEELKSNIENKVDEQVFEAYKKETAQKIDDLEKRFDDYKAEVTRKIDDLENRSKRNYLVFWNIPEGEERERPLGRIGLVQDILILHTKLVGAEDIIIERAHRSGGSKRSANGNTPPRPIHVRFLNWSDKDYIIRRAPKSLKNNPFGPAQVNIIVTDDVSKKVREQRRILKNEYLPDILRRPHVKVAFVPYLVPARIQYKQDDPWEFFFINE